ncbi:UNVERIFIED_CONTAM: Nuclear transcription factor Y subunit C-3 [Sesamum angustifolium]|uniref:Nuclear transcription factor Y subunit C-3 n=1 Tax=Sesamum angustifolium TaxID=2727405 RepID=A0AAW2NLP2_9LAMI
MDFNQSIEFSSTPNPPLQMHNFMPMPSPTPHVNPQVEEVANSCFVNQLKQNIQGFWRERMAEICDAPSDVRAQHTLPLARIKKVMKSDEQVKMISADTPVVFAKACEMFIMELTLRAWMHTQENKRRTLQRNDVANAIRDEDLLSFLKDIVPMEVHQEDPLSLANHLGVYIPQPYPGMPINPIYPMNAQNIYRAVPTVGRPVVIDHPLAFPMNLQHNINPAFFTRNQEMQQDTAPSAPHLLLELILSWISSEREETQ